VHESIDSKSENTSPPQCKRVTSTHAHETATISISLGASIIGPVTISIDLIVHIFYGFHSTQDSHFDILFAAYFSNATEQFAVAE